MEADRATLGAALRAWRLQHGLTQAQVARAIAAAARHEVGMHPTHVSQIERGVARPSIHVAAAIGRVIGIGADAAVLMIASPVTLGDLRGSY